MSRYYERPDIWERPKHGRSYYCEHPLYLRGTLYSDGFRGLVVIQQRFDPHSRRTWWNEVDPWLVDELYLADGFREFFDEHAAPDVEGLYPTYSVRQVMNALGMRPMRKQRWETVFDHSPI